MKYDFDTVINRRNTNSVKWDMSQEKDIIPMWIADMDFKTANLIIKALEKRVQHGIFGYSVIPDAYYEAEVSWWDKRHNFKIKKEWIEVSTGVIPSLSAVVQAFTEIGDKVLIQSPVYNYFNSSITNNKCIVANEEYRKKVNKSLNINETIEPNVFGIEALIAAYDEGEDWKKLWN